MKMENRLNKMDLALAGGILVGAGMFIATLVSVVSGYAKSALMLMSSVYPGYTITPLGSIVGLAYGFVDAFIGFYLLAWLYNKFGEVKSKPPCE